MRDARPGIGVGLGLAAVGRPAYINAGRAALGDRRGVDDLRRRTEAVLDAAYAAGMRYLDVARSYGRAEEFLAEWLAQHPAIHDVEIGSKWGYRYVGEWRMDAPVSSVADDADLHRELGKLRDRGVRIGISTSGPRQADAVRKALTVEVDGRPLFTSIQSTWNLLEPSAGPALAEAAAAGARVIVKEAVANGRLAPGSSDIPPVATALAAALELPLDRLAIAAALAQPWAWCVLSGAVDEMQVASNAAAAGVSLPEGALTEAADLAEEPERYWSARAARPWA
jgi:aryl-alcohol dehydrogenase-like predicted oxidoreductase